MLLLLVPDGDDAPVPPLLLPNTGHLLSVVALPSSVPDPELLTDIISVCLSVVADVPPVQPVLLLPVPEGDGAPVASLLLPSTGHLLPVVPMPSSVPDPELLTDLISVSQCLLLPGLDGDARVPPVKIFENGR